MSHETVRRWVIEQDYLDRTRHTVTQWNGEPICVEVIRASDYDTLRTQARELAEALQMLCEKHGHTDYPSYQFAQAVLDATKEVA